MTSVDKFLNALAVVESSDDPEAWGDAGRAMGRWQVHPERLWSEARAHQIEPKLGETWDQFVARVLRAMFTHQIDGRSAVEIAMFWHVGNVVVPKDSRWDAKYAARFEAAAMNAQDEMP